ncbi:MAG: hypothetical protein COB02_08140 [Candidatus Cloacimonadota bacterium]|nr:MAG: hypothetical protein COB02_08140 [Candidatus Cloacimonadota bacterium]
MIFLLIWWAFFCLSVKKIVVLTPFYESGCLIEKEECEYTGFTFEESSSLFSNFFNNTFYYLVALLPLFFYSYFYKFSHQKLFYILLVVILLNLVFQFWFQSKVFNESSSSINYLFNFQKRIHIIMLGASKLEAIFHQFILGDETYFRAIRAFKESLDYRFSRQQVKADEEDYTHPEKLILNNLEPFMSKNILEVMKNIKDVEAISSKSTVKEGLEQCSESGYSRLLVLDDKENVIGIFRGNQVSLLARREQKLLEYMDGICKLTKTMSCYESLRTLQKNKRQLGLVHDSNKVIGLVTMEDLVEVFVGKIEDEFDMPNGI